MVVRIVIKGEARLCQDEQRRTKRRPRCIFGLTDRALDIAVGLDLASTGVRRAGGGVAAHVHVVGVERVLEGVVTLGGRVAPGTAQIVEVPAHGIGESAREGRRLRGGEHQHERDKYHKRAPHDEKAGEDRSTGFRCAGGRGSSRLAEPERRLAQKAGVRVLTRMFPRKVLARLRVPESLR